MSSLSDDISLQLHWFDTRFLDIYARDVDCFEGEKEVLVI